MNDRQLTALAKRDRAANAAYDRALAPARLALRNPARVPYPVAVVAALAAYDAVVEEWRPRVWPDPVGGDRA